MRRGDAARAASRTTPRAQKSKRNDLYVAIENIKEILANIPTHPGGTERLTLMLDDINSANLSYVAEKSRAESMGRDKSAKNVVDSKCRVTQAYESFKRLMKELVYDYHLGSFAEIIQAELIKAGSMLLLLLERFPITPKLKREGPASIRNLLVDSSFTLNCFMKLLRRLPGDHSMKSEDLNEPLELLAHLITDLDGPFAIFITDREISYMNSFKRYLIRVLAKTSDLQKSLITLYELYANYSVVEKLLLKSESAPELREDSQDLAFLVSRLAEYAEVISIYTRSTFDERRMMQIADLSSGNARSVILKAMEMKSNRQKRQASFIRGRIDNQRGILSLLLTKGGISSSNLENMFQQSVSSRIAMKQERDEEFCSLLTEWSELQKKHEDRLMQRDAYRAKLHELNKKLRRLNSDLRQANEDKDSALDTYRDLEDTLNESDNDLENIRQKYQKTLNETKQAYAKAREVETGDDSALTEIQNRLSGLIEDLSAAKIEQLKVMDEIEEIDEKNLDVLSKIKEADKVQDSLRKELLRLRGKVVRMNAIRVLKSSDSKL